jgi:hypothetical protein
MIRDRGEVLDDFKTIIESGYSARLREVVFLEVALDIRDALLVIAAQGPRPELPMKEPIGIRRSNFIASAIPGTIFVNEYGRRSEIICEEVGHVKNPTGNPEYSPWYRVKVLWPDHEPTEEVDIWYNIGKVEGATSAALTPSTGKSTTTPAPSTSATMRSAETPTLRRLIGAKRSSASHTRR